MLRKILLPCEQKCDKQVILPKKAVPLSAVGEWHCLHLETIFLEHILFMLYAY